MEPTEALAVMDAIDDVKSDADHWRRFDAKAKREEMRYEAAAMILFNKEREQVAKRIRNAAPPMQSKADVDPHPTITDPFVEAALLKIAADYAPGGAYHRAWLERYRSLISATTMMGGRELSNQVGLSFSLRNERAQLAVRNRVTKLTGSVTETTIQRIRETIVQAREDGVGVSEVARRIREDAFNGDVTRSRAQTIARTETVGALNEGQFLAATERGVMQSKRWLSQQDGRVRDSHRMAESDGWLEIEGTFSNGLRYPHEAGAPAEEVINCVVEPDALVITSRGPRPIASIDVRDFVLTHRNRYRRVVRIRSRDTYSGAIVTLRTADGEICVTGGHPLLTRAGWNRADRLQPGDEVHVFGAPSNVQRSQFITDSPSHRLECGSLTERHLLRNRREEGNQLGTSPLYTHERKEELSDYASSSGSRLVSVHGNPVVARVDLRRVDDSDVELIPNPMQDFGIAVDYQDEASRDAFLAAPSITDREATVGVREPGDVGELGGSNHTSNIPSFALIRSVCLTHRRDVRVYNFSVEEDESYVVEGFVSHNCRCTLLYSDEPPNQARRT